MQISKMIDMLLRNIAKEHKAVLIEFKTYKKDKVYKNYKITIGNSTEEFKSQIELLMFLKDWK